MPSDAIYGDAFKVLPELEDESFELVFSDPPYNISRPNNFSTMGRTGFDWGWDVDFDICDWLPDAYRLTTKGGSIIVCTDWKLLGTVSACLAAQGAQIKDPLVLEKSNPQPRNTSRRYVSDKEFAVWAVKPGAKWTFNPDPTKPYERSLFRCAIPRDRIHPTKKPPAWMEKIISVHSNRGDRILDPFAGEGTIGVAAAMLGRTCLSIEQEEDYFQHIVKMLRGLTDALKRPV